MQNIDIMELWNTASQDLILLYKSKELRDTDYILCDKLESLLYSFSANIVKGDLMVFVNKVDSVYSILTDQYFQQRYYDKDLMRRVLDVINELMSLCLYIKKNPKTLMTVNEVNEGIVRLPNTKLDEEKIANMYNY